MTKAVMTDEEIREILIERKRQERYAADEAKWNDITEWLLAFFGAGIAAWPIVVLLFGGLV